MLIVITPLYYTQYKGPTGSPLHSVLRTLNQFMQSRYIPQHYCKIIASVGSKFIVVVAMIVHWPPFAPADSRYRIDFTCVLMKVTFQNQNRRQAHQARKFAQNLFFLIETLTIATRGWSISVFVREKCREQIFSGLKKINNIWQNSLKWNFLAFWQRWKVELILNYL